MHKSRYRAISGKLLVKLEEGEQVIRLNITGSSCNVDKVVFEHLKLDDNIQVNISSNPSPTIVNTSTTIRVDATSPNGDIASVKVYVNNTLLETLTEAPFEVEYTPTEKKIYKVTAVATDTEGYDSQQASYDLRVNNERAPFNDVIQLPGVIEAEDFDKGGNMSTFYDKDAVDQGNTGYRTDNEGLDIITTGNGGYAVGNTMPKEWMEYTVNVTEPGVYAYEATVSSIVAGSNFSIGLVNKDGSITDLCKITIPKTGNKNTYQVVTGTFGASLKAGEQILRITINAAMGNIDKVKLSVDAAGIDAVTTDGTLFDGPLYTPAGVQVDYSYKGIVIKNGKKIWKR